VYRETSRVATTYNINPRPCRGVLTIAFSASRQHDQDHSNNAHNATPPYRQHSAASPLVLSHRKPPYARKELRIADYTHDRPMCCEQKVVESHRRLGRFGVPLCILRLDCGRVQERCSGQCVAGETEDVEGWKIDCEAKGGFVEVVFQQLGVEGCAPTRIPRE